MAETSQMESGNGRRRFRNIFKRPSQASSLSPASASQTLVQLSSSQFLVPALASPPSLGSASPQLPASTSSSVFEVLSLPLSGQDSTASLNLWGQVFCKVNKVTQEWIQKNGLDPLVSAVTEPEEQMKELTDLIREKEKLFEEKSSPMKIKIGNQAIICREYIADIIGFLTIAGNVGINFAPPQASVPWAAVKAVLKVPVQQIEQMAALAGTIQLFTRIVRRGQVYEALYNDSISTEEGTISNLRDALINLYAAAIELLARSDTLFQGGLVRQTLNAILQPGQALSHISDLLEKEQILSYEAQSCEALRNEEAVKQTDEKMKSLLTKLDVISPPLTRIDEGVAELLEKVDNDQLEKLMDFISSEQFGKGHAAMKDTRIQGTGDWLIVHESFREWQAIASSSTLLCLKGTVGTGKTYLTSRVIDHIKQTLETSPHDEGFAFFYCNRSGPSMQDSLVVLRSFVRQLSCKANNYSYIQSNVIQRCEKAKQEGRSLSYTDCKELILESMNLYSKTTIILDALDESDISYYNLAEIFIDMLDKARKPVKVFISSRPDREFLEAFKDRATIMVNSRNQQGDIEKYLAKELYATRFFQKRPVEIQELIKETFKSRNGGMFRWVYLQTKSLRKCVADDAVRTWAKTIPRDLSAAYDRLWEDITSEHNESDMALAMRAIKWVLCAFEPLQSELLLEAISYAYEGDCLIQSELRTEQDILTLCQDFLTVDAERKIWMLPHVSVAEYFESKGVALEECDAFISKILLGLLTHPDIDVDSGVEWWRLVYPSFADLALNDGAGGYAVTKLLESYAWNSWFKHVQRYDKWLGSLKGTSPEFGLTATLERFLGSPGDGSSYYRRWISRNSIILREKPANVPFFIMCRYGFYYTLRNWWENDKIDQKMALTEWTGRIEGEDGPRSRGNSLVLAASGGCMPICRHLVSAIGAIGLRQSIYCEAAEVAISRGDKSVVELLVEEANVDLNMIYTGANKTLVQYTAERRSSSDMLQWMVDQGWVDVNRQGGSEVGNALIAAANKGNLQSLEILLRAGADARIPAESGEYGTALIAAAASRFYTDEAVYGTVIVTLLNNGADINQIPNVGKYGSALEAFIWSMLYKHISSGNMQRIQILKFLLKCGADPAMTCNIGNNGSALAAAAYSGYKKSLKTMVDATGKQRAIECLRRSRPPPPDHRYYYTGTPETFAYLVDEVGVDKEILQSIGIRKDITPWKNLERSLIFEP